MVEAVPSAPAEPMFVRVRSAVGSAVVIWRGAAEAVGREHHVEWTVDEDVVWAGNAWPSLSATPEVREDGDHTVLRGVLSLDEDGVADLDVGGALIMFEIAEAGGGRPPLPDGVDGSWVEVRVARDRTAVWPFEV
ncbi:hypothetical protein ACIRST_10415 [Kitasatospora sp. NPDC101447]|uniref:hypothetical protein n=1 Tax=Kitasatospora sp. NPDC101447 TaxID=3364102 RepID=UPI0037F2CAF0